MVSPGGNYGTPQFSCGEQPPYHQPPLFPSMSVNVSMNMTMHGYPNMGENLQHQVTCPQVCFHRKLNLNKLLFQLFLNISF